MKLLFLLNGPMGHSCFCTDCFCVNLVWAIALMVTTIVTVLKILKYLDGKAERKKQEAENERTHEAQMKDKVYAQEKAWAEFNETKASTTEGLKGQVKSLKSEIEGLKADLNHQKKVNDLLSELVKKYEESMPKLKDEPKSQDEQKDDTSNKKE